MNYTKDRFFVDTNLFVYAYDSTAGLKWTTSKTILSSLWENRTGVLSNQVLQEIFVSLTRKLGNAISIEAAKEIVSDLLLWSLVVNDGKSVLRAIDLQVQWGYSFWDSLILQAAVAARADFLLTEDLQDGQVIDGVTIVNPFLR